MPLFEYVCKACGKPFEVLTKNASDGPKSCPCCKSKRIEKQLSVFSASAGSTSSMPCESGACPGGSCGAGPGGGCSTGACPFG